MRLCVICGAKVRNPNPKSSTCNPICTEIKNRGGSIEDLVRKDSEIPEDISAKIFYRVGVGSPVSFTQKKKLIHD